jgi:hypothetical protein
MKTLLTAVVFALCTQVLLSQASNEDCNSAIDIGNVEHHFNHYYSCFDGDASYDTGVFYVELDSAIPNYPFLFMKNCEGYTDETFRIGNDLWYTFTSNQNEITIRVTAELNHQLHLNIWKGDNCSNLKPYRCYTIDTFYFSATFEQNCFSRYYLQFISDTNKGSSYFGFCLKTGLLVSFCYIDSISVIADTTCFEYSINIQNASNSGSDGKVTIDIPKGNQPYSFYWEDGSSDSIRIDLDTGVYNVTITDVNGCKESDSARIEIILSNKSKKQGLSSFEVFPNPAVDFLIIKTSLPFSYYLIRDIYGNTMLIGQCAVGENYIDLSSLVNGVYFVSIVDSQKVTLTQKIIRIHD